jgi:uncharacterized cupin superfamily protein
MHVTRIENAPAYFPPEHNDMRCLRLQGHEAGPAETLWMGMSQILPGGHTSLDASPLEKLYIVLEGEVAVSNGTEEVVLRQWDSCRVAPGEGRQLRNRTNRPATILLSMPFPARPK